MKSHKNVRGLGFKGECAALWSRWRALRREDRAGGVNFWRILVSSACCLAAIGAEAPLALRTFDTWTAPTRAGGQELVIRDHLAFLLTAHGGLAIYDITRQEEAKLLGSYNSGTSEFGSGIAVIGNYVYIPASQQGIRQIDVSDVARPRVNYVTAVDGIPFAFDIVVKGNIAFVSTFDGVSLLDVSNPAHPVFVSRLLSTETEWLELEGNSLFVSHRTSFDIYDVSNPRLPVFLSTTETPIRFTRMTPAANRLYIHDSFGPVIHSYDLSNRAAPAQDKSYQTLAVARFVVMGDYGYAVGAVDQHIEVFVLNDPSKLTPQARIPVSGARYYEAALAPGGLLAIESWGAVHVFNLANPLRPERAGQFHAPALSGGLAVAGTNAFFANGGLGLQIVNVSDPSNLVHIATARTFGSAQDVTVLGGRAYVAAGEGGLEINDVSNPQNPSLIGRLDTPGNALSVAVDENIAYVADDLGGLQIINVSDPTKPRPLAKVAITGGAKRVHARENIALVGSGGGALFIFDVTSPISPELLVTQNIGAPVETLLRVGNRVYLNGADTLDISNPRAPFVIATGALRATEAAFYNDYLYAVSDRLRIYDTLKTVPTLVANIANIPSSAIVVRGDLIFQARDGINVARVVQFPRISVTPPPPDTHYHVGDLVTIHWTSDHMANPIWTVANYRTPIPAEIVSEGNGRWHADFLVPDFMTNSWSAFFAIREETSGAHANYGPFVMEVPSLSLVRYSGQLNVFWSGVLTNYTLFTKTNLTAAWTKAETNSANLYRAESFRYTPSSASRERYFQLIRNPP